MTADAYELPPPLKRSVSRQPGFVEQVCRQHLADGETDLTTVCSTPNGVSSYLLGDDETRLRSIRHEQGNVVVRSTGRFGTLIAVLGGPSVVEIALHNSEDQRDAYRETVAAVDAENREQMLAAIGATAQAVMSELGVSVEEQQETL